MGRMNTETPAKKTAFIVHQQDELFDIKDIPMSTFIDVYLLWSDKHFEHIYDVRKRACEKLNISEACFHAIVNHLHANAFLYNGWDYKYMRVPYKPEKVLQEMTASMALQWRN